MRRTVRRRSPHIHPVRTRSNQSRRAGSVIAVLFLCCFLVSCMSVPQYPVFPPPSTKTLPVNPPDALHIVRTVLNEDPRLVVDTVDNAGRFVAFEKTSGFIFFQKRTILDIRLEPVGSNETKVVMNLRAEAYKSGGLTRTAGWYPVAEVNSSLGEDIMDLIERRAEKTPG